MEIETTDLHGQGFAYARPFGEWILENAMRNTIVCLTQSTLSSQSNPKTQLRALGELGVKQLGLVLALATFSHWQHLQVLELESGNRLATIDQLPAFVSDFKKKVSTYHKTGHFKLLAMMIILL